MTYCSTLARPLLKKIEAGKNLDDIGAEICGNSVKNPRKKAIRLIKELLGEEALIEHASTLGYNSNMAAIGKREKSSHTPLQKNETGKHNESEQIPTLGDATCQPECTYTALDAVRELAEYFSIAEIKQAVATMEQEKGLCETTKQ